MTAEKTCLFILVHRYLVSIVSIIIERRPLTLTHNYLTKRDV